MRSSCATRSRRKALICAALAIALMSCALFAFPGRAHATYKDVADSFPATQDLGSYGAPITGDRIPDGAYKIGARTSSRMCIMYTNPEDADARDSKEQAVLFVSGGQMTVLFYISKAYTHLYLGTQEEAAALTNEDGTDASAYIAGDPDEGYVPHLFQLSLSALNEPMTIATFSGGDKGVEGGKWYTREVVFTMTEEELQEIIAGPQEEEQPAEEQPAETSESTTDQGAASVVASDTQGAGSQQGGGNATQGVVEEVQETVAEPEPKVVETTGTRGMRLRFPQPGTTLMEMQPDQVEDQQPDDSRPTLPMPLIVLAVVTAAAFAVGAGMRVVLFARSYDGPMRSRGSGDASETGSDSA